MAPAKAEASRRAVVMVLAAAVGSASLAGCDWLGGPTKAPLPGDRISVLSLESSFKPDERVAGVEVRLPAPRPNADWPQAGGSPQHAMGHLAAPGPLTQQWRVSIGSGGDVERPLLAEPVVADGRVYTLDTAAQAGAFDAASGAAVWRRALGEGKDSDARMGGGIAYSGGRLFVTTGFAEVIALNAETGEEIWRRPVSGPLRAPPTVYQGRVYALTIANEVFALSPADGSELWRYTGIAESAGLLGGAAPAAADGIVVVPFSSGDLVALRADTGRVAWQDSLVSLRRSDPVSALAHIRGAPVIDNGRVFAISHSSRMVSYDLASGRRIWEREIGGTQQPWVAGDFVFVVTNGAEVVCLTRENGSIRWIQQLEQFEDPKDKEDLIQWSGPVLVGDRLLVVGSNRDAWSISPYTGRLMGRVRLSSGSRLDPVVAAETVYILSSDGSLIALR